MNCKRHVIFLGMVIGMSKTWKTRDAGFFMGMPSFIHLQHSWRSADYALRSSDLLPAVKRMKSQVKSSRKFWQPLHAITNNAEISNAGEKFDAKGIYYMNEILQ